MDPLVPMAGISVGDHLKYFLAFARFHLKKIGNFRIVHIVTCCDNSTGFDNLINIRCSHFATQNLRKQPDRIVAHRLALLSDQGIKHTITKITDLLRTSVKCDYFNIALKTCLKNHSYHAGRCRKVRCVKAS